MDLIEITNNSNRHPWEDARRIIASKFISSRKKKNIKLLDVGSGDAYLADDFTKKFHNCHSYCVDTGYTSEIKNKIENTYKNNNLNLYSSLKDVDVNTIDIVTLLDVIEHVPNDVDFLNSIISQPYINNDTFFIITVPAYQSLFSRHDELLKHYRRYSLPKLKETVTKCDLKFIDSGYFFFTLLIPRIIKKISSKSDEKLDNLGTWKGGKLTTTIIKSILLFDYKIGRVFKFIGINLPGLSCYIICQKINK